MNTAFQIGEIVKLAPTRKVYFRPVTDTFEVVAILPFPDVRSGYRYQIRSLSNGHLRILREEELEAANAAGRERQDPSRGESPTA